MSLSATASVTEDQVDAVTYTATLTNAAGTGGVTVTTAEGDIVIAEGATTGTLVINTQDSDVYLDADSVTNTITAVANNSSEAGALEAVAIDTDNASVSTDITDTTDTTKVSLSATASVTEDQVDAVTYTATLTNAAGTGGVTVTTAEGDIVIAEGATTGTLVINTQDSDVYLDADSVTNTITAVANNSSEAGALEAVAIDTDNASVSTDITDTTDTTKVSLSATASVTEDQVDAVTYTATLTNAAGTGGVTVTTAEGDIVIAEGATTGTLVINTQDSDVYLDADSVTNTITAVANNSSEAGALEAVAIDTDNASVSTDITDTTDTTKVSLSATASVTEDQVDAVTYTATLTNAAGTGGVTVTTAEGDIVIAEGATTGTLVINTQDSDVYLDADSVTNTITAVANNSSEAGALEAVAIDTDNASVSTDITDTTDTTKVSLSATASVTEDQVDAVTYTATLTNAAGTGGVTVTTAEGDIVIAEGATTGTLVINTQDSDVYLDADSVTNTITAVANNSSEAGALEAVAIDTDNASVSTDITDTTDTTKVSLSATASVTEDQVDAVTYTATLTNAAGTGGVTVTTAEGDIVIAEGATTGTLVINTQDSDVYLDADSVTNTITAVANNSSEAGALEAVAIDTDNASVSTDITDTTDTTKVSLSATASVTEDQVDAVTYTATLTNAAGTGGVTVTTAEGDIVIAEGATTGTLVINTQDSDVYLDADSVTNTITAVANNSSEAGALEAVAIDTDNASVSTDITDTTDTTKVSLSATASVTEDQVDAVTYTATLTNAAGTGGVTVTTAEGDIVIAEGATTGTLVINTQDSDVYLDADSVTNTITAVANNSSEAGALEAVAIDTDNASVSTDITDTTDTTKVSLSATASVTEDQVDAVTYTATLTNAAGTGGVTVTTAEGDIVIAEGATTGTLVINTQDSDVYLDADSVTNTITAVANNSSEAGALEAVAIDTDNASVSTDITDTTDTTKVSLSATASVTEDQVDAVTYTATLTNAAGTGGVTVTTAEGDIVIAEGATTGTLVINTQDSDVYLDADSVTNTITAVANNSSEAGALEAVAIDTDNASVSTDITDTTDTTKVSLSATASVTEDQVDAVTYTATLTNAAGTGGVTVTTAEGDIVIAEGATTGTLVINTQDSDVYLDADSVTNTITAVANNSSEAGALEAVAIDTDNASVSTDITDTTDTTKVSLSATASVTEDQVDAVTYTATLTNAAGTGGVTVTTAEGDIVIAEGATTGTLVINTQDSDVYLDADSVTNTITAVANNSSEAGALEAVAIDTDNASVSTDITDTTDTTKVSLSATASVTEDQVDAVTYTATLTNAAGTGGVTVTTAEGDIVIAEGATTGTLVINTQDSDVYLDADSVTNTITAVANNSSEAGALEAVAIDTDNASVSTDITDTTDTTKVSLSATASVTEDQVDAVTYTATLTNAAGTGGVTVTTAEGDIVIAEGATTGTLVINTQDSDVYLDADSVTNTITAVANNSSEAGALEAVAIDTDNASVSTDITDTTDTTKVSLSATASVTEDQVDAVTYTATLTNAAGTGGVTVTTAEGDIVIAEGATTGTLVINTQDSDVYLDADSVTNTITAVANNSSEAGALEAVAIDTDNASVSTDITDTTDTTKVSLSATASVTEDQVDAVTYTATLTNAAGTGGVTVTTAEGDIVIAEGATTGTLVINTQDSDVYLDADSVTNTITAVANNSSEAGALEAVAIDTDNASVSTDITDTIDNTTVTLSSADVDEGADITITATVDNAPEADLVLTLDNGETITIAAGATSNSVTFANPLSDIDSDQQLTFSVTASSGGNYESLDMTSMVDVLVTDTNNSIVTSQNLVLDGSEVLAGVEATALLGNADSVWFAASIVDGAAVVTTDGQSLSYLGTGLTYDVVSSTQIKAVANIDGVITEVFNLTVFVSTEGVVSYSIDLIEPLDPFSTSIETTEGFSPSNDASKSVTLADGSILTVSAEGGDGKVNGSGNPTLYGVKNGGDKSVQSNESLVYTSSVGVNGLALTLSGFAGGDTIVWKAYAADGTTLLAEGTAVPTDLNNSVLEIDTGVEVSIIKISAGVGEFQVVDNGIDLQVVDNTSPTVDFAAVLLDSVGNQSTVDFSITFDQLASSDITMSAVATNHATDDAVLVAGAGAETLIGLAGQSDTFEWNLADGTTEGDRIQDFEEGSDVIDLSDLLTDYDKNVDDLSQFITVTKETVNGQTNTVISVNSDGAGTDTDQRIVVENRDWVGTETDMNTILSNLIGTKIIDPDTGG